MKNPVTPNLGWLVLVFFGCLFVIVFVAALQTYLQGEGSAIRDPSCLSALIALGSCTAAGVGMARNRPWGWKLFVATVSLMMISWAFQDGGLPSAVTYGTLFLLLTCVVAKNDLR